LARPNRDGLSPDQGLLPAWTASGPPLAWKATGIGVGFSSVAVAGTRLYTMGDTGGAQQLMAFNRSDGKPLWTARIGAPWRDEMGGPRGTPTVDGDLVYAIGTEGDLVCVEAATGKERWRKSLVRDFGGEMMSMWKFSESPLVDGDRVVVTPGAKSAALVALDKKTGKELWRAAVPDLGPRGKDGAGYSSIMISNGGGVKQYVQLLGRGLVGVRASDGKFLWGNNHVANHVANISTPIVKDDYVFASTGYQTGSVLLQLAKSGDGVAAREVYFLEAGTLQNHHGGLVLVGDHVYAARATARASRSASSSSPARWRGAATSGTRGRLGGGGVRGRQPGLPLPERHGRADRGHSHRLQGEGLVRDPGVKDPSWSHPVVLDGILYLREQDTLYAYDVKRH